MMFEVTYEDGTKEYLDGDILHDKRMHTFSRSFHIVPINGAQDLYYTKIENVWYLYIPNENRWMAPNPPKHVSKAQIVERLERIFDVELPYN